MSRIAAILAALMAAGCSGVPEPAAPAAPTKPLQQTHVQFEIESLGELPNSGLQLPAVAPDGQWIAYLRMGGDRPAGPEALFTGRGLAAVSLHLRPLRGGPSRTLCAGGAAWPTWSADATRLAFIVYAKSGRCDLAIHDLNAAITRRRGLGFPRMMMPALDPAGKAVALIAAAELPAPPRLHVADLKSGKLTACPTADKDERHLWPQWTPDGRIVYVTAKAGEAWVAHWQPGGFPPEKLHRIHVPSSLPAAFQTFAGLASPLSPDGRSIAYYDIAGDHIVLVDLSTGQANALSEGTRCGCWLDDRRFVAAGDKEMRLFFGHGKSAALLRGAWLPLGSVRDSARLVLCRRGSHRRALGLVQMDIRSGS